MTRPNLGKVRGGYTVLITSFRRPAELVRAIRSCEEAKVEWLVAAAKDQSVKDELKARGWANRVLWTSDDNNESWLAGLRAVKTEWVTILHDDDTILPEIFRVPIGKHELVLWECDYLDHWIPGARLNEWDIKESGIYSVSYLRSLLLSHSLSVTPVHGVYRRDQAIAGLELAQSWRTREWEARPGFIIGNDLLLWLKLTEGTRTFYYHKEPAARLGCTKSITVGWGPDRLMPFYNRVRDRYGAQLKFNPCSVAYLPPRSVEGVEQFHANVMTKKRELPLYLYSHTAWDGAEFCPQITEDTSGWNVEVPFARPDVISAQVFFHGMSIALREGHTHVIYVENDCRVNDGWDKAIAGEFFEWRYHHPLVVCGGSPVCWQPCAWGYQFEYKLIDLAANYQDVSGVPMALEGGLIETGEQKRPIAYPNGALGIYSLQWLCEAFGHDPFIHPERHLPSLVPWDWQIGRRLCEMYGMDMLERIAPIGCAYSGCKDHHVTAEKRLQWYQEGKKVAVHQIKGNIP